MLRTHTCGDLTIGDIEKPVTLCGWVDTNRDHGGTVFIDLRDRYGKTQVVFDPSGGESLRQSARGLKGEDVIQVTGVVSARPEGTRNPRLATGDIELRARELKVLNRCKTPPFSPSQPDLPSEELRLKYRYLDLRRPKMQETLILRDRICKLMRDYFADHQFLDVETPILGRSTPEGARDYLVPSRVHHGMFFALPQSPQLYKQLMMVAGYDRYVQIARCFRDEDLRADRQPEFTQLDLEMSFVEADDVMGIIDGLMVRMARELAGITIQAPLPRMTYDEAMRRFGHDAPDLRFGMEIVDCTDLAKSCEFRAYQEVIGQGGFVRGLNAKGAADKYSRRRIDQLTEFVAQDYGCKGLGWFKVESNGTLASSLAKYFDPSLQEKLAAKLQAEPGDLLLLIADTWDTSCKALNGLRKRLATELQLFQPGDFHFSWVVEFPMFEFDEQEQRWAAKHHPFTAPRPQDLHLLESDTAAVRAVAYDLVVNGFEAGGGTIRIHDQAVQQQVFGLLGMDLESARSRFGFLMDALQYGAPPHGGIALGLDRLVMAFAGRDNIRDCIAFPKTQRAMDLMTEAPNLVAVTQLNELAISVKKPASNG